MLFNSYEFILLFLPVVLVVFYLLARVTNHDVAIFWLVIASIFFYGWWNPYYVILIVGSMLFNYSIGLLIGKHHHKSPRMALYLFVIGITVNLGLLGYFKYFNFFINNLSVLGFDVSYQNIILPLAISFFTFQQIAFLTDVYQSKTCEYNLLHYGLFVVFFPQLIAGPIVHHKEMLPQFEKKQTFILNYENLSVGAAIFIIGLFKKVIIADGVATYSTPVFNAADQGEVITFFEAWGGAVSYSLQLYFDFSGYSDMAIGLARMFGFKLPMNFYSPYKATNIIDFWRRWHITLSRFLRDYLYFPLGGNRKGKSRRYVNLLTVMLLGGLWHGAGWTFVIWGGLHGLYLVINHAWHAILRTLKLEKICERRVFKVLAWSVTFLAVVVAWVFFRATTYDGALNMMTGMMGFNGIVLPESYQFLANKISGLDTGAVNYFYGLRQYLILMLLVLVVVFMPNTQQMMRSFEPAYRYNEIYGKDVSKHRIGGFQIRLNHVTGIALSILFVYLLFNLTKVSEFLYFQF